MYARTVVGNVQTRLHSEDCHNATEWCMWRRQKLQRFMCQQLFFVGSICSVLAYLRRIERTVSPYHACAVAAFSFLSSFLFSHNGRSMAYGFLAELVYALLLILTFTVMVHNSFNHKHVLAANRARWFAVHVSLYLTNANGFAPRVFIFWYLVVFFELPLSTFGLTQIEYTRAYALMDVLTATSSIAIFLFLRWCTQSQFKALQVASRLQIRSQRLQMSGKLAVENLSDASCTCSEDGRIISSTVALDGLLKYCGGSSSADSPGRYLHDFIYDPDRFLAYLKFSSDKDSAVSLQFTFRGYSKPIDASALCVFLGSEHEAYFLGVSVASGNSDVHMCPHTIDDNIVGKIACMDRDSGLEATISQIDMWEVSQILKRRMVLFSSMITSCAIVALTAVYLQIAMKQCWACVFVSGITACAGLVIVQCQSMRHNEVPATDISTSGFETINLALQLLSRCGLESAIWLVSHNWVSDEFLTGWRFYSTFHFALSYNVTPLMDLRYWQYLVFVAPVVVASGICFSTQHGSANVSLAVFVELAYAFNFCHFMYVFRRALDQTTSALKSQEAAQNDLGIAQLAFTKMQQVMFDATCYVNADTLVVRDCSPTFAWTWPPMVGVPIMALGAYFVDRKMMANCVEEAVAAGGARAVVARVRLKTRELGTCPTKLLAVLEDEKSVLLGVQLEAYDIPSPHADTDMEWLPNIIEEEELTPGDSASNCQDVLIQQVYNQRLLDVAEYGEREGKTETNDFVGSAAATNSLRFRKVGDAVWVTDHL